MSVLPLYDLKPGDTLGRYEILLPIARGGMATVWAARQTGSRGFTKLVAIKTMLPGMSDDPDFEAMFLDEARLAAKIRHPHVVEIIDLGDEEDWIYIVMEWVNGETMFTLNKRAKSKGGIPLPLMLRIASCACAGLHAAHELRDEKGKLLDLVHRDVSPQNIMIGFDGIVKLVDFGVAKATGRAHETRVAGIMKGKVPYLSPEQLNGNKVDRRSDLFSLGILMYVMVSGRHPFRGESDARTMENICTRAPVPLRDLVPNVRPDLEAVVMRALEKEPGDRWQTGAEMQRALDQVLVMIGTAVTDGDVANFVRAVLGDLVEERQRQLEMAIHKMDQRGAPDKPIPQKTKLSAKRAVKGGAPLPATFDGILPVALVDEPAAVPARRPLPSVVPTQTATLPPPARSGSAWRPSALVGILALAVVAVALRTGNLPWLAELLPPWLSVLAPPSDAPVPEPTPNPPADSTSLAPAPPPSPGPSPYDEPSLSGDAAAPIGVPAPPVPSAAPSLAPTPLPAQIDAPTAKAGTAAPTSAPKKKPKDAPKSAPTEAPFAPDTL